MNILRRKGRIMALFFGVVGKLRDHFVMKKGLIVYFFVIYNKLIAIVVQQYGNFF